MSYVTRSISGELSRLMDKKVIVRLVDGKVYVGKMLSFDPNTLHIVLGDAESNDGKKFYRIIISGTRVSEILIEEQPLFDAEEFATILTSKLGLRPDVIKVLHDVNVVVVYDRIKVSESGVEGAGSFAQRIYEVYTEYIENKKRGAK
ncbi:MAG: Lsm family RNA-binding protein [Ignisphaera sp.]|uniref:Sm ribonucleo n=1 Tax=Ignisphaera aggregans TaxID=334771 RepID=A0A7C4H397_9CREN